MFFSRRQQGICCSFYNARCFPVRTGSLYPYISFTAEEIRNIQPIPFTTISLFAGTIYWRVQIFGNILLLAPVPVFLGLIRPDMNGKKLFFTGLLSSVSIEALQLLENMAARYPNRDSGH